MTAPQKNIHTIELNGTEKDLATLTRLIAVQAYDALWHAKGSFLEADIYHAYNLYARSFDHALVKLLEKERHRINGDIENQPLPATKRDFDQGYETISYLAREEGTLSGYELIVLEFLAGHAVVEGLARALHLPFVVCSDLKLTEKERKRNHQQALMVLSYIIQDRMDWMPVRYKQRQGIDVELPAAGSGFTKYDYWTDFGLPFSAATEYLGGMGDYQETHDLLAKLDVIPQIRRLYSEG